MVQLLSNFVLRLVYRIEVEGVIDAPPGKGVLLIANHVSFVDFLMMALLVPLRRPIIPVMDYLIYKLPVLHTICRNVATIPITSKKVSLEVRENAFAEISQMLAAGHYVLFFPEGTVTHDGKMTSFQYGLDRIKTENPSCFIVPITITGLLGGFFSRVGGLFAKDKLRKEFGRRVRLKIGPAIPATRWKLEHIETKVKLMLSAQNAQEIESSIPIELPAIREDRRTALSTDSDRNLAAKLTTVNHHDGYRLVFLDHSSSGFCIEIAGPLDKGAVVMISLEQLGLSYSCSVRWCQCVGEGRYKVGLKIMDNRNFERFLDLAGNF